MWQAPPVPNAPNQVLVFFKNNWGNIASVAGLLVSAAGAFFAKRASQAASEARASVLSRTREEDIGSGLKLAEELTTLVAFSRFELALSKCSDLLDLPNRIRIRWAGQLSVDSKNNWLLARQQLESIHAVLTKAIEVTLSPREVQKLNSACIALRTVFVEEQAAGLKIADQG